MTDDLYYRKLENTSTTDLVDMIREKDKSIAELEEKLEQTEKDLADYQFNYPTIKELEKENAELKETVIKMNNVITETFSNLTKAKEIIKKFLLWENDWHDKTESKYELLNQAEQFLSEVEK